MDILFKKKTLFLLLVIPLGIGVFVFNCQQSNKDRNTAILQFEQYQSTLRAFAGAPPIIPHPVLEFGRGNCLSCHLLGNAVKQDRIAPITTHPKRLNCQQCHVESFTKTLFRDNTFIGLKQKIKISELSQPLAAPYIPHQIQNRKNCEVCHIQDHSKQIIHPIHGFRDNCMQCHISLLAGSPEFNPKHILVK